MKKRIVTTILALAMALSLCACGGGNNDADKNTENKNTENSQMAEDTQKESESETTPVEDGKIVYKVTVVDEGGNPVANAMVQVCDDATCFAPAPTNADGVAEFQLAEADGYKTKLVTNPAGYEAVETDYVYFESGKTEATLTVKAVE